MATECVARLTLTGDDFDPDDVTRLVGFEPSKTWRKGDQRGVSRLRYEHNGWSVHSPEVESLELQDQVRTLLGVLKQHWSKIASVREELGLDAEIACSIVIEGTAPWIHFDREVLALFVEMGAEIDVDILAFSERIDDGC